MPVLSANIRAFNSKAESLKLHNLYFGSSSKTPRAGQSLTQARLRKSRGRKRRFPQGAAGRGWRSLPYPTRPAARPLPQQKAAGVTGWARGGGHHAGPRMPAGEGAAGSRNPVEGRWA